MSYTLDSIDAVNAAIANYSLSNSDSKSELLVSYGLISVGVSRVTSFPSFNKTRWAHTRLLTLLLLECVSIPDQHLRILR